MKSRSGESPIETRPPACTHNLTVLLRLPPDPESLERAAGLFRAMGDAARLRILHLLLRGEVCVGEIVTALSEKFSTVSQRLRILRTENLVSRRREGSHVYYALADAHVKDLVSNALAHASELDSPSTPPKPEDES